MFNVKDMTVNNASTRATEVELNSARSNDGMKENVEIFSKIIKGEDVSKYGKKAETISAYMKQTAIKAEAGDANAQAEINAIRTIQIQTPLEQRLQLMKQMGEVITVGKNEKVEFKVFDIQGTKAREQAASSPFPFASAKYRTDEMTKFHTITGGTVIDYREIATGNLDAEAEMQEQVQTDMMNQMWYLVYDALYTGIKDATSLKNFAEATGIAQATLDAMLKKAKRWSPNGAVTIAGDYSAVSQLNNFAGFATDAVTGVKTSVRYSEAVMNEIMQTGLLSRYNKHSVVEIPNSYNVTKLNTAGDYYETYLPEGLAFLLPAGITSPLKIGQRGGIETMTGQDITTRKNLQRFDLEFGTYLVKEQVPQMGLISDDTYLINGGLK